MNRVNMNHTSPPGNPADWELLAYIDGHIAPDVAEIIEASPSLLARARELAAERDQLAATLYRLTCPPPVQLGAFLQGTIAGVEVERVRRHLTHCPHCSREVSLMRHRLAEREEPLSFRQWLRILVGRLQGGPDLMPTLGYRGAEDAAQIYELDEGLALIVGIIPDPARPSHYQLDGLLPALDADRVKATLWQEEEPLGVTPLDPTGGFSLTSVPAGDYELVVQGEGLIIHIHSLVVGD